MIKTILTKLRSLWAHLVSDPKYIHPSEKTRKLSSRR
jgi:hypothetical protein